MTTTICSYCGGEKSWHAQLCSVCLKFGKWMEEISESDQMSISTASMTQLLRRTFALASLKPRYVDSLLAHEAKYVRAFTSRTWDEYDNYEIYEHLGDGIANAVISWYFIRRFPQINCDSGLKVLARLKINYISRRSFASIAERLGFWPYIRASDEKKASDREALLEDVLEAFVGVTVSVLDDEFAVGVGYGIVYDLFERIFDEIDVSLEYKDLYDAKSRLKELFDAIPSLGRTRYVHSGNRVMLYRESRDSTVLLSEGEGRTKPDREQMASRIALDKLAAEGYARRKTSALICDAPLD